MEYRMIILKIDLIFEGWIKVQENPKVGTKESMGFQGCFTSHIDSCAAFDFLIGLRIPSRKAFLLKAQRVFKIDQLLRKSAAKSLLIITKLMLEVLHITHKLYFVCKIFF